MKANLHLIAVLVLIFQSQLLIGQTIEIQGTVSDSITGETLIGVSIIAGEAHGTASDVNGHFKLTVSPETKVITLRYLGYQIKKVPVNNTGKALEIKLQPSTTQLDMVVVSAGRHEQQLKDVTVSMEVIKPELIEARATKDMEDFMQQVPGVNIMEGQANIRGGSGYSYGAGSRVMVLIDDLPMLAADAQDVKWNTLPVENIGQVEVIKGAASALYGSSALNGVINMRTKYPESEPTTRINVYHALYDDPVRPDTLGHRRDSTGKLRKPTKWWDYRNPTYTGMEFSHARKIRKQFDLVLGGHVYNDNGYREGESEEQIRGNVNTRYRFKRIKGLSAGVNSNIQRAEGKLFFLWADADSGALRPQGGLDTATTTLSGYTNYRVNVDPFISWFAHNNDHHSLRTRWYRTNNTNDTHQSALADLLYGEYQYQHSFGVENKATAGVATYYSYVRSQLYGDHDGNNLSLFGQIDATLFKKLHLSFGIRGEYYRVDTASTRADVMLPKGIHFNDSSTTWGDTMVLLKNTPIKPVIRLGMSYPVTKSTFARASFGGGYRFPTIAEKYVNTSVGVLNIFPNPGLQSETGWSTEIGIKQGLRVGKWSGFFDIAAFWTEYQNMMEFTFGLYNPDTLPLSFYPNNPGYIGKWMGFQSQNVGNARITGLESTLVGSGKIGPLGINIMAGYTFLNPINISNDSTYRSSLSDTSSNMLKYRYKHMVKADLGLDYGNLSLGCSFRYNSTMVNIDRDFEDGLYFGNVKVADVLPGLKEYRHYYNKGDYVWDGRLGWSVKDDIKVALVVNNLMNAEYMGRPGDIQAPRTYVLQYTMSF